nr:hypothetical protein [Tanacetum cinerariifolium]
KSVTSSVGKQGSNAVKSSACWVWRPKIKVQDYVSKNSGSYICKRFDYDDPEQTQVSSSKRGEITGKGKIRTGKLDFKDVYFVKELKFNLFSVSQIRESSTKPLGNLVRGIPLKIFENDHTYVACQKGKQHKASSKKDETSGILKDFITGIENQLNHKVKIIKCDNRTEFKNYEMNQFCRIKGIKREFRQEGKEKVSDQKYILLPVLNISSNVPSSNEEVESSPKYDAGKKSIVKPTCVEGGKIDDLGCLDQQMKSTDRSKNTNSTNSFNTASPTMKLKKVTQALDDESWVEAMKEELLHHPAALDDFSKMPNLEYIRIFDDAYNNRNDGAEADYNNLETVILVSHILSTRIHKDHPKEQIIREVNSAIQTRKIAKQNEAGLITFINKQRRTNHKDFQNYLFASFLSQMKLKKVTQALDDESWVEAMKEELLQFKLLNV